jgi:sugar phosphate isomerase/epimerase/4-hydroxyphenylpyruvate dioxygenase-like putative hemolysin
MLTVEHDAQHTRPKPPVAAHLDIATVCLSGTLEDKLAAAAAAGFQGVEIFENDLVVSPWSPRRIRQHCADLGLSIDLYQPFADFESVPPDVLASNLRRAERKFDVMEHLGVDTLLVCSSVSPDAVDDDDLAAEQLHLLASRAAERGMRIAYEAMAWGRFVNTYEHSWRIVRSAGHPALGLCLDSFHVLSQGSDLAALRVIPGSKVFFVQVADASRLRMDALRWSEHHRLFPGQGAFDLTGFASKVLATGYSGPLSVEVFNDVFRQTDPGPAAIDAMRSMVALRESLGAQNLPAAPQLSGHAFTELAVDEISAPSLIHALRALGFTRAGHHRSKPVQLWQQGTARVLLNSSRHAALPGTASITAFAVDSADPPASAQRAERLLAPLVPRFHQQQEADLPVVTAPDGTAVFFCRPDGDWLGDFELTGEPVEGHLAGTDHVSLTQPFDDFDRAALFYRAVLGLHPEPGTEFAAPFGLMRSQAVTDVGQHVRIALNTSLLRRGEWAPAVREPQHIAFSTNDAVAAAEAMRAAGAPLLDIPANYYEDLDARLAPPPELLAALREFSVLYDRDEHGEFLHFYTEVLGSRVFFEVVQRIGGYNGYGTANSPVRMAAQRQQRLTRRTSTHDYSVANLTALSVPPPDLIDTAANAGYRYVGLRLTRVTPEEPHFPLLTDKALMRDTKRRLADTGMRVLDVELVRMGPDDDPHSFLPVLEAGVELGARHVITQLPDPDRGRKTERFAILCDLAKPLGLTIDLEFIPWTDTRDLAEAIRVLKAVARPNSGILVDLLHFARSESNLADLRKLPRRWFNFAHVCDAPAEIPTTTEGLIHTARFDRLFPGEGGIDVRGILAALPTGIPYALEIPRAALAAQVGEKECVRLAIRASRRYLDPKPAQANALNP